MRIPDPKGKLREATQYRYQEDHSPVLMEKVSYDRLLTRCRYFAAFDAAFARLATPKRRT